MQRLFINTDYRTFLADAGLEQFEHFVSMAEGGELVAQDKGRTTHRVQLGGQVFFLKSVHKPIVAPTVEALLTLKAPHHYCWREKLQVDALQAAGIAVMDVAAAGESTSRGILDFSFLLAPEVQGDFLDAIFSRSDRNDQLNLLGQLGEFVGRLHSHGFFAPVRMKDIIVSAEGKFVMIDRETRKPGARRFSRHHALQGLGRTLARQSRDGIQWGDEELKAHLAPYLEATGERLGLELDELQSQVIESTRKATRKKA
jgi:tRNA A-37 threonylcarbamoyl transferase component Bud32